MSNLDNRSRDQDGTIRKKRSDTKVENLKKDYPEFKSINGNKYLGTVEKELGTHSLDETLRELRKQRKVKN
jgi:hypothetical protein